MCIRDRGKPCVVNYWMPDGFKDVCVDTKLYRDIMKQSLDEIFAADIDETSCPARWKASCSASVSYTHLKKVGLKSRPMPFSLAQSAQFWNSAMVYWSRSMVLPCFSA